MYRNWETNKSIKKLNGHYFLLPKISANVAFLLNPIHDLQCEVGYQYIGYVLDDTPTIPNQYANLYVKADYTLSFLLLKGEKVRVLLFLHLAKFQVLS